MNAYTLYDGPLTQPGACVCGSQTMPMLDTHRVIRGYGRVYLCPTCVLQAAHAHGYVCKADHERAVGDLAATVDRLEGELKQALDNRVVSVEALLEQVRAASVPPPQGVTI